MLNNIIKANKNDLILQDKFAYCVKIYKYYWETTCNVKYLYLYQASLRDYMKHSDYIRKTYLKDLDYKYFYIDIVNSNIYLS